MKHPDPPSKPSELIRLALRDLRAVEKDPDYTVNMDEWHSPPLRSQLTCEVCFAGSVMAKTCKVPADESCVADDTTFSQAWQNAFHALNYFREGKCNDALGCLPSIWRGTEVEDRQVPRYEEDPSAFHLAMEALAAEYEAVGA